MSEVPRVSAFDEVSNAIWRGYDVLADFRPDAETDEQGWNSDHVFLTDTMTQERPRVVVELGVWKGASVMTMAASLRDEGIDGCVVAVDTWLGSSEHWMKDMHRSDMRFENGYPRMYYTFLSNIVANGLERHVIPLPLDSANAAIVLRKSGVVADVVHIDGSHDYESTLADVKRWWEVLKPGGVMIVDDYDSRGRIWQTVRRAVDDFLALTPHTDFEWRPVKARFRKVEAAGD